jgi:hypothetical protein
MEMGMEMAMVLRAGPAAQGLGVAGVVPDQVQAPQIKHQTHQAHLPQKLDQQLQLLQVLQVLQVLHQERHHLVTPVGIDYHPRYAKKSNPCHQKNAALIFSRCVSAGEPQSLVHLDRKAQVTGLQLLIYPLHPHPVVRSKAKSL